MTPYWHDSHLTLYGGDCRAVLAELPAESVHCVVTSPPYWGLRDYGTATWEGGDVACDHRNYPGAATGNKGAVTSTPMLATCSRCGARRIDSQLGLEPTPEEYVANMVAVFREVRRVMRHDATLWLNLGDSYASHDPGGYREGEFLNPGGRPPVKGQARNRAGNYRPSGLKPKDLVGIPWRVAFALQADGWYLRSDIIWAKPNPMPESVTDRPTKAHEYLYLLAKGQWKARVVQPANGNGEGLHLGSDFWPTSAPVRLADADFCVRLASSILDSPEVQEKLRLSALDAEVGQEGATSGDRREIGRLPVEHRAAVIAARLLRANASPKEFLRELNGLGIALADGHHLLVGGLESAVPLPPGVTRYGEGTVAIHYPGEVREFDLRHNTIIASRPSTCSYYYDADAVREADAGLPSGNGFDGRQGLARQTAKHGGVGSPERFAPGAGRNLRSVWNIATEPYPGAHFATFPRKLVEPCVKAGTSEKGVCPECGAPWVRVVERRDQGWDGSRYGERVVAASGGAKDGGTGRSTLGSTNGKLVGITETTGWQPTCSCVTPLRTVPAVVLDPFAGSGTTLLVAQSLGRRGIGIDLSPDYLRQALRRASRQFGVGGPALEDDGSSDVPDDSLWSLGA